MDQRLTAATHGRKESDTLSNRIESNSIHSFNRSSAEPGHLDKDIQDKVQTLQFLLLEAARP